MSSSGSSSLNPDKVGNVWPFALLAVCLSLCACLYLRQHVALLVPESSGQALLCLTLRYFVAAFYRNPLHSLDLDSPGHTHTASTLIIPREVAARGGVKASGSHPLRLIQKNYKRCLVSFASLRFVCLPRVNLIIYLIVF